MGDLESKWLGFPVPPAKDDAERDIFNIAAAPGTDFHSGVYGPKPPQGANLRAFLQHLLTLPLEAPPVQPLGTLDPFLPLEVLYEIARHLDIASLLALRRTNRRGLQIVASLPEFVRVVKHMTSHIQRLFQLELATNFTIIDLHTVLTTERCFSCGRFGGYVFLPNLTRCCFNCPWTDPRCWLVDISKLPPTVTKQRLQELSVPICYTTCHKWSTKHQHKVRLATHVSVIEAVGIAEYQLPVDVIDFAFEEEFVQRKYCFATVRELPFVDFDKTRAIEHGISCVGCEDKSLNIMGTGHGTLEDFRAAEQLLGRLYSFAGFIEHFKECPEAKSHFSYTKAKAVAEKRAEGDSLSLSSS